MAKQNKFDPKPEPERFEPEKCETPMTENEEAFAVFCQRMLGTSKRHPLVVAGEPLNGASIGNLAEAFAICRGLGKQSGKQAGDSPDALAARRAALTNREEKRTDA
jgi:hypothetical protein